ncbi:OmpH family outer membrane protein [Aureibacter tunicatorum]|uniref:Outer membrane protein n=1 Tax=Aureibacter tunicatorum TaxID=866807 RepID=A0AAE3XL87_9BACT|nr:OmpH family outer membrane protein [Aureibacter tunicatorum]MDR6238073.1 outer membrane protein [Aureibacter tunicatorum]BDD03106.1 membrane protein [Aureibacter tunicatorum]
MKKLLIIFFCLFGVSVVSNAQKFGYVDTEYVLSKMPEYAKAQEEVNTLSATWQSEIQQMYKEIEGMYDALQAEEVLLTAEMKKERQEGIKEKEQEVKEYHKKVFGFEGLFFLKKKELIKPVQDLVFEAVEKVSKKNKIQIMFDKSGDLVMIYTNPVHDYTDYVLEELGLGDKNDTVQQ